MFAAAGMVVTETSTPISAPDLAEVSDRTPAMPATKATKNEKKPGSVMKLVCGCLPGSNSSGTTPVALKNSVASEGERRCRAGSRPPGR